MRMTRLMNRRIGMAVAAVWLLGGSVAAQAAEITVSAAASLTNAFREVGQAYERRYPGARVHFNFGGSGALLQQMAKGAPVDVFASADEETMNQAQQHGLVRADARRDFARNALVLIVPADSRLALHRVEDLAQPGVHRVAVGNPASVPVGRYSMMVLGRLKSWPQIQPRVIHAVNVRQALDYVARGEVDAGLVYRTDAAIMPGKVKVAATVPLPVAIRYPIASTTGSSQQVEARRFVQFVLTPEAQALLARYGFGRP